MAYDKKSWSEFQSAPAEAKTESKTKKFKGKG